MKKYDDIYNMAALLDSTAGSPPLKMVIVAPYDRASLEAVVTANQEGVITPVMVGNKRRILENARLFNLQLESLWIVNTDDDDALEKTASIFLNGGADFIMKGMVGTGNFIHVLLDPRWKIRTERILSHVGMLEIPVTKRVFLMSDGAINILPNFTRKIHIIANSIEAAKKAGIGKIKVAMLAAVEKVKLPAMPATLDAFLMKKYAETGYFGECEIDGPFAFDNALDPESAKAKGLRGNVAGQANVLIVPNIETGNVIWKSYTCLQGRDAAGVVLGGACPIVVPSRSDDFRTKLFSIKFARLLLSKDIC
jgi:phosphate butyryltransferase